MEYTEGYVAFLDVLGFSKFVEDENNGEATRELFDYTNALSRFFNTSPNLNAQVSFFSDTIIITSTELYGLLGPIYMAEISLKLTLGLLFRGGIAYGKYYHNNGIVFGPAVVSGYLLEKNAVYSRIVVEKSIDIGDTDEVFFEDVDGYKCFNPYGMFLSETLVSATKQSLSPDDTINKIIDEFSEKRKDLISQINKYKGTSVVDKYLWRTRAFNYICKFIVGLPMGESISNQFTMNEKLRDGICQLIINESDILQ